MTDSAGLGTDEFVCPDVQVGDTVLWSPDGGGRPTPALVTAIGRKGRYQSRIDLQVIHPEVLSLDIRTGCPHRDDPKQRVTEDELLGKWHLGPMHGRFTDLKEEIENIKLSLAGDPAVPAAARPQPVSALDSL